jgi:hypothetical protein
VGPIEMHESAHPTEQNRSCSIQRWVGGGAIKKGVRGRVHSRKVNNPLTRPRPPTLMPSAAFHRPQVVQRQ